MLGECPLTSVSRLAREFGSSARRTAGDRSTSPEQSGIHEVHISDLERGAREVGLRHLAALAGAFELSLSEFLKGIKGR